MGGASTEIGPQTTATSSSRRRTSTRCRSRARPAGTSCRARRRSASSAVSTRRSPSRPRRASCSCSSSSPAATRTTSARCSTTRPRPDADPPARSGYIPALIGVDFTDDEVRGGARRDRRRGHGDRRRAAASCRRRWRPDLHDKSDLAEEVARIVGYDRIPSVLPVAPPGRGPDAASSGSVARSRRCSPTTAPPRCSRSRSSASSANDTFGSAEPAGRVPAVRLANPLDATAPYLRTLAAPGAHRDRASATWRAGSSTWRSTRSARSSCPTGRRARQRRRCRPGAALPRNGCARRPERRHPGPAAPPRRTGGRATPCPSSRARRRSPPASPTRSTMVAPGGRRRRCRGRAGAGPHQALHPGRTAELVAPRRDGGRVAGRLRGRAAARARRRARPARASSAVFELDLDALIARRAARTSSPGRIAGFPAATQDLSLVVPVDGAGRPRCSAPCARARGRCSSTSGSSTTTAAPGSRRGTRASPSRSGSGPTTARSPRPRPARRSSPVPRVRASCSGAHVRDVTPPRTAAGDPPRHDVGDPAADGGGRR